MLTVLAGWLTLAVLVQAFILVKGAGVSAEVFRPRLKRMLLAGVVAWVLCHVAAVLSGIEDAHRIASFAARATPKDFALAAWRAVVEAWWGSALLALCLAAAASQILARRGMRRGAILLFVAMGVVLLLFFLWESPPASSFGVYPASPSGAAGGGSGYVPEEARITVTRCWYSPLDLTGRPVVLLLEIPAGIVVALGIASILRVLSRRRAWPCPPTDALLLLGTAASLCISVLHIETLFMERAEVLVRLGPKAPSPSVLLDDFLHASAPAAAVLGAGLAVFSLGMLDRVRGRRADGGSGR